MQAKEATIVQYKPHLHALPADTRRWVAASIIYGSTVLGNGELVDWQPVRSRNETVYLWGFFVDGVLLFRMYPSDKKATEQLLEKLEKGYTFV